MAAVSGPRLSLNQATVRYWPLLDAASGCAAAGIADIGIWRDSLADCGLRAARSRLDELGMRVTSLCRGGFFTADGDARSDNLRAIEEAVGIGTDVLVLVAGGIPAGSTDLDGARHRVADAIAALVPDARAAGVRLAIEPMHPMFCADRGVVSTLGQATALASQFPADAVGVVVDSYHVWWDPQLDASIVAAGERIALVQVSDWITPLPAGVLLGRGRVGDGCIDNRHIVEGCIAAGYSGAVEVEIFSEEVWCADPVGTVADTLARYRQFVGSGF